ncbi:MAG: RhuM family protein [Pseudomonadota bacterium]
MTKENSTPIVIYENADQAVEVRLDADQETLWLTQAQMAALFGVKPQNITMHLKNIYAEGELVEEGTCKNLLQVQPEGNREVKRQRKHYSLDAVISVGYRISSARATQFRIWATRVLREHLTQGWTINRHRFEENARELEAALTLVRKAARSPELDTDSGRGLVDIVSRYAQTFLLLQRYDEGLLTDPQAEAKAAHLLYFVIKNHPFSDGNKRSAAFLFVDFLHRNSRLFNTNGESVVNDVGLAALTLLVAESDPANKETMIRLIMNMLAEEGE